MVRSTEYSEIFEIIKGILQEKYEATAVPSSASFEAETPAVIEAAIEEWNALHHTMTLDITVEYLGGSKFPDIVLHNNTDDEKIGIEVKFHKTAGDLETLGNSAIASTQIEGLEGIFVLFGHFGGNQRQFIIRNYGDCICAITKTHRPRYKLDMSETTDFCATQLGISYDELRGLEKTHREIIINSYVAETDYVALSDREDQGNIRARSFILFPEIFASNQNRKYRRLGIWLFANNIYCRNVRDFISGSGRKKIDVIGESPLPKVFYKLYITRNEIKNEISLLHPSLLKRSWYKNRETESIIPETVDERLAIWIDLLCEEYGSAAKSVTGSPYGFKETITRLLFDENE